MKVDRRPLPLKKKKVKKAFDHTKKVAALLEKVYNASTEVLWPDAGWVGQTNTINQLQKLEKAVVKLQDYKNKHGLWGAL